MKEWFRARNVWGAVFSTLPDAEAGALVKALWEYTMTGQVAELQGSLQSILSMFILTMKQDEEYDNDISSKRSACGLAGAKKREANRKKQNYDSDRGDREANQAIAKFATDQEANQAIARFATDQEAKQAIACNKNQNKNKNTEQEKREQEERKRLFARFWEAYPKHVSRQEAEREFEQINPDEALLERMLTAIEQWKKTAQWGENGGRFIPYPATWLNQRRWEDEAPTASVSRRPTVVAQQYEQRDYSGVQAELIARQDAEMEEYMRLGGLGENDL